MSRVWAENETCAPQILHPARHVAFCSSGRGVIRREGGRENVELTIETHDHDAYRRSRAADEAVEQLRLRREQPATDCPLSSAEDSTSGWRLEIPSDGSPERRFDARHVDLQESGVQ